MHPRAFATAILAVTVAAGTSASAGLIDWQSAVSIGTPAGYTNLNITSPITANIGAYNETTNGGISYEFIVNATNAGVSSALMGKIAPLFTQEWSALKWEQFQDTGRYGVTNYQLKDYDSGIPNTPGVDTHVVFVNNSVDTLLYVNGFLAATIVGASPTISGEVGIGGARLNRSVFIDPLQGAIVGVAVYDAALSPAEIAEHARAYAVPEPGGLSLAVLAALSGLRFATCRGH